VDKTALLISLATTAVSVVMDFILGFLTGGIWKGVKLAWIAAKGLYFFVQFLRTDDSVTKSTYLGNTIGNLVHFIYAAILGRRRMLRMQKRLMNRNKLMSRKN